MKAEELLAEYVKEEKRDEVGLMAHDTNEDGDHYAWHVHTDEEVPDDVESLQIKLRRPGSAREAQ